MSLRIRRGTDAQRQGTQFDLGEPVFTTDTGKLYIGDGVTQGANNILATSAGIGMSWNATTQKLDCTVTGGGGGGGGGGITAIIQDTSPTLGGNLSLSGHNISGTGNINITGSLTTTGSITGGSLSTSGTIIATQGLGADLPLNGHNITGTGNINTSGTLGITGGLSRDLSLNSFNLVGTGNINTSGSITGANVATGLLTITGSGQITGGVNTVLITSSNQLPVRVLGITNGTFTGPSALSLSGSKGTLSAPTNTAAGDIVTQLTMEGYYNGGYKPIGSILGEWDATANLADAQPRSNLTIVLSGGGSSGQYFKFIGNGGIFYAPILTPGSYAGVSQYPAAPAGIGGPMIFDSVTNHFMGWNGTIWKQLDN